MTRTDELIAQILKKPAISDLAARKQFNNSITKNSITQNISRPEGDDLEGVSAASPPYGEDRKVKGFKEIICGAEIQLKKRRDIRQQVYITLQTYSGVENQEAMNYTAYLVGRKRGREFKRLNSFDEELYQLSLDNPAWLIGHLTERTTKQIFNDIVVTLNPETNRLALWFSDYSGVIEIETNNKPLTFQQQRYFESAGIWGNQLQLPGKITRSFLDCQTRVGGRK